MAWAAAPAPRPDADVLIIGAGIAGLSAAHEAAAGGARVLVMDMSSVFGGHAVITNGGLSIVGTPFQKAQKINDTPELAFKDFTGWGGDADPEWVRYYVNHSRAEIYDWLTSLGIGFDWVIAPEGNSVPRFHRTTGKGLGLISPIYRECLKKPNIAFVWNTRMDALVHEHGSVAGVDSTDLRSGKRRRYRARIVILATGGFQSNLELVRKNWPRELPVPERLLAGAGHHAAGSGLAAAQKAGAALHNLDHQWNYALGLPDPRYPGTGRGMSTFNPNGIWVNVEGRRFVNEFAGAKTALAAVLRQKSATYWSIFDEDGKAALGTSQGMAETVLKDPSLTKSSETLEGLAATIGLPAAALVETVQRFNQMVEGGEDADFGRFGPRSANPKRKIERPPFYAQQMFPITRKSMGGLRVDLSCRVLDEKGRSIPGLYAAGEVAGFAGINGKAGLEGTFLGPSIVTGRVAGRSVLQELAEIKPRAQIVPPQPVPRKAAAAVDNSCARCHDLAALLARARPGYWHFEKSHRVVLEQKQDCAQCHAEMIPYRPKPHRVDRVAQIENCKFCHGAGGS